MCGIAGMVSRDARADVTTGVEALTAALAHRGPDGTGFRYLRGRSIGLGHRRLSIVDLKGGAQPMTNEDGRVWVILNGELYNHLELRRELERKGHRFATRADTEVLVHGWEEWGEALCERLNGIYAFALYDGRGGGELCLVRDPVGVKPLYVGVAGENWWFASELQAAKRAGLLGAELRPDAFDEYLVYRFVPSPGTFYRQAWKVPPGHILHLFPDRLPSHPEFRSFTPRFEPTFVPSTKAGWAEALREGLRAAVRRQLMSDVPVGSLLSGGVDSTVVTSLMSESLPEPPATFAIGFADHPELNELSQAQRAAAALGVSLTPVAMPDSEYLATWPIQVASIAEPIANSAALLVGLLCGTVQKTHKVVLTGQGADEPLGGYPRHVAARFYPLLRLTRPFLGVLSEGVLSSDRVARLRRIAGSSDEPRRFVETLAVFSPEEAVALTGHKIDAEALVEPVRYWLGGTAIDDKDPVNRFLLMDARLSLADDLLIVADHMSMSRSVELRVPFLDLQLLALIERMPSRFKISRIGERKWLYRDAVRPLLPPFLRSALTGWRSRLGRRLGFATPFESWFRQWEARECEGYLLGRSSRLPHYVLPDRVGKLLGEVSRKGAPRSRHLLALYVLETWLRGVETPSIPSLANAPTGRLGGHVAGYVAPDR